MFVDLQAVTADRAKDVEAAAELYEESLNYFLPLLHYEADLKRREKLRATVSGYQRRLRELKGRHTSSSSSSSSSSTESQHASLLALCRTSSSLLTGVSHLAELEQWRDRQTTDRQTYLTVRSVKERISNSPLAPAISAQIRFESSPCGLPVGAALLYSTSQTEQ